MLQSEKKRD